MLLMLFGHNIIRAQCPATVTISGSYTTIYTGSNTWIASSGITTIPTGSNVTLDANPLTDGYVLLDTGFETQLNSIFLAKVQTPCALLGLHENEFEKSISIYPNPTNDVLNIYSKTTILSADLFNLNGRIILSINPNSLDFKINLDAYESGIYLLKVDSDNGSSIQKIIKN